MARETLGALLLDLEYAQKELDRSQKSLVQSQDKLRRINARVMDEMVRQPEGTVVLTAEKAYQLVGNRDRLICRPTISAWDVRLPESEDDPAESVPVAAHASTDVRDEIDPSIDEALNIPLGELVATN